MSNQFIKTLLAKAPSRCPATETSAAPFPGEQIPSRLERSRDNVGRQFKQLRQNTPAVFTLRHYGTLQPRRDWPISGISSLLQLFPACDWFCGTQRIGGSGGGRFPPLLFLSSLDDGTQGHWEEARVADLFVFQMENPRQPHRLSRCWLDSDRLPLFGGCACKINPARLKPDVLARGSGGPGMGSGSLGTRGQLPASAERAGHVEVWPAGPAVPESEHLGIQSRNSPLSSPHPRVFTEHFGKLRPGERRGAEQFRTQVSVRCS